MTGSPGGKTSHRSNSEAVHFPWSVKPLKSARFWTISDGNGRRLERGHMASFYRVTHTRRNYVQAVVPSTVDETQMRYA